MGRARSIDPQLDVRRHVAVGQLDERELRDMVLMIHRRARRLATEADALRRLTGRLLDGLEQKEGTPHGDASAGRSNRAA